MHPLPESPRPYDLSKSFLFPDTDMNACKKQTDHSVENFAIHQLVGGDRASFAYTPIDDHCTVGDILPKVGYANKGSRASGWWSEHLQRYKL